MRAKDRSAQGATVASRRRRVFHVGPLRLWLWPGVLLLVALATGAAGSLDSAIDVGERAGLVLIAGILTLVSLLVWVLCWYARIVIDERTIEQRQVGYHMRSDWKNVVAIVDSPGSLGLVLGEPVATGHLLRTALALTPDVLNVASHPDLLAAGRFIDLGAYRWHWRRGELARLVHAHLSAAGIAGEPDER